ncbi:N-acetyltransferase [Bacteroidia bacterium]|nr:N-acetyltransferase [Bacteroidia bacterium]GHT62142.1 N-acetyltransferase [Bacteroidia bacterium]
MIDLGKDCDVYKISQENLITNFNCGNADLNDFFNNEAILFQQQSLGQTHFFRHIETGKIVCVFSISADSVKTFLLSGSRRKKVKYLIPHDKSLQSYPAFLIGRLGVSVEFGGQGIGSQLLNYVKYFVMQEFYEIGRFLVVDAYNKPDVLAFYRKNDFEFLFTEEQQERENLKKGMEIDEPLHTRQMFYDLKRGELP